MYITLAVVKLQKKQLLFWKASEFNFQESAKNMIVKKSPCEWFSWTAYAKMNCIILNSFPIMCPVLATFCVSMGASLTNYLVLFSHVLPVCIRKYMYIFLSVCMSVHLREVGGLICHSSPYILQNMNACSMIRVCSELCWRWFMRGLMWP